MSSSIDTTPTSSAKGRPGTVRAALGHRDFRILWYGLFASNIGTWMQNLALPAYVDARTHKARWVAIMGLAQLGPLLILSIPGGVIGDKFRRRPWLITSQTMQGVLAVVVAFLVSRDWSLWSIFAAQLGLGVCNALGAPATPTTKPEIAAAGASSPMSAAATATTTSAVPAPRPATTSTVTLTVGSRRGDERPDVASATPAAVSDSVASPTQIATSVTADAVERQGPVIPRSDGVAAVAIATSVLGAVFVLLRRRRSRAAAA